MESEREPPLNNNTPDSSVGASSDSFNATTINKKFEQDHGLAVSWNNIISEALNTIKTALPGEDQVVREWVASTDPGYRLSRDMMNSA